jgi:lactoylglutathione lyase
MNHINHIETILYVRDQERSAGFYQKLLRMAPDVNLPGMTEFNLSNNCKLGLMPNSGIAKILLDKVPHPESGNGIPRCELYLHVDNVQLEYDNALACGATLISDIAERDWGDRVCYFADPDGHIIAFAERV